MSWLRRRTRFAKVPLLDVEGEPPRAVVFVVMGVQAGTIGVVRLVDGTEDQDERDLMQRWWIDQATTALNAYDGGRQSDDRP